MYKISVIIPVYNAEKYLKRAIDSVIRQSIGFENIEIVIVDDASTDNSKQIIEEYATKYPNIKAIFLEQNSGTPAKPRNVGIENAAGEYIMTLDSDDEFFENACELLYDEAIATDFDMVCGYYSIYDEKGNLCIPISLPYNEFEKFRIKSYKEKQDSVLFLWGHCSKIFKKSLFWDNNIKYVENGIGNDTGACLECILNANGISNLKIPVVKVCARVTDASLGRNRSVASFDNTVLDYQNTKDVFVRYNEESLFKFFLKRMPDSFIDVLTESSLNKQDILLSIKSLSWIFMQCSVNKIEPSNPLNRCVYKCIIANDYSDAVEVILALRELMEANNWLKEQYSNYVKTTDEQKQYIDLLIEGKNWLESQYNNYKELYENTIIKGANDE